PIFVELCARPGGPFVSAQGRLRRPPLRGLSSFHDNDRRGWYANAHHARRETPNHSRAEASQKANQCCPYRLRLRRPNLPCAADCGDTRAVPSLYRFERPCKSPESLAESRRAWLRRSLHNGGD